MNARNILLVALTAVVLTFTGCGKKCSKKKCHVEKTAETVSSSRSVSLEKEDLSV